MMESLSVEEENIMKVRRKTFKLEKDLKYTSIKKINLFRLEKKLTQLKIE